MKKLFFLFIAALLTTVALAGSSAVILKENVIYTISTDGKVTKHVHQVIKLNTPTSYRAFGEWFHTFDPALEEVRIINSQTTQKDGTRVQTPENGILIQSPFATRNSPDFSHMRELMVSHTGLEPGSVIDFEYVITDKRAFRKKIKEDMAGYFPLLEKTVTIKGKGLGKVFVNGPIANVKNHTFTVKNVPAMILSHRFSQASDTPFIYLELNDPIPILKTAFEESGYSDDAKALAQYLKLNESTPDCEIIDCVLSLVNKRLSTVRLSAENTGFSVRGVKQIYTSGYATDMEKAFLAHATLKHFNIHHSIIALVDTVNNQPIFADPEFAVIAGSLVYPESISLPGKTVKVIFGEALSVQPEVTYNISLRLEEDEEQTFKGNVIIDVRDPGKSIRLKSLLPLKGLKLEKENVIYANIGQTVLKGAVSYTLTDDRIDVSNIFKSHLHLDDIPGNMDVCSTLSIPSKLTVAVHILFSLNDPKTFITSNSVEISNDLGSSRWSWKAGQQTLELDARLELNQTHYTKTDFSMLSDLLTPVLKSTHTVVFVE